MFKELSEYVKLVGGAAITGGLFSWNAYMLSLHHRFSRKCISE